MRNRGRMALGVVLLATAGAAIGAAPRAGLDELVGTWKWSYKDAEGKEHKHVLEVEGSGEKVAARERYDDGDPVKVTDLKLSGKKVTFSVRRDDRTASYNGELKEKDRIQGLVNVSSEGQANEYGWEASREAEKPKKK